MLPSQSVRPAPAGPARQRPHPPGPGVHRDPRPGRGHRPGPLGAAWTPPPYGDAIHTPLTAVLDGIGKVLRDCPPDLVADLADRGIMMVGGSALLPGLDQMLRDATGMPVHIAERPDVCAVLGLGAMLEGKIQPHGPRPAGRLTSAGAADGARQERRPPVRTADPPSGAAACPSCWKRSSASAPNWNCAPPSSTSWTSADRAVRGPVRGARGRRPRARPAHRAVHRPG